MYVLWLFSYARFNDGNCSDLLKNSQAVKKGCGPMQNDWYKKSCEIKVAANVMVGQ